MEAELYYIFVLILKEKIVVASFWLLPLWVRPVFTCFFVPSSGRHGFEALLSSFAALVGVKQGVCTLFEPF